MLTLTDTLIFTHCRTVITLFNAIQQSQASEEDAQAAARATRGSGKATLAAPPTNDESKKRKRNALGNGKDGECMLFDSSESNSIQCSSRSAFWT